MKIAASRLRQGGATLLSLAIRTGHCRHYLPGDKNIAPPLDSLVHKQLDAYGQDAHATF